MSLRGRLSEKDKRNHFWHESGIIRQQVTGSDTELYKKGHDNIDWNAPRDKEEEKRNAVGMTMKELLAAKK